MTNTRKAQYKNNVVNSYIYSCRDICLQKSFCTYRIYIQVKHNYGL
jgi:hypothetical protein